MFEYDFMINAFAASGIVAVLAGIVGYFLVLRGQTFAGHALSHVGFTGATGAVLLGISPIWGMVGFTLAYHTDWPTSFWITALSALVYGVSLLRRAS
jgi:zinc/manganese transport system permease protein